jgi:prenyltransferase beta subunit
MIRRIALVVAVLGAVAPLCGQTPEQKQATVKFLQQLQAPDGGFAPVPQDSRVDQVPRGSLRATSSALRALKYFGGKPLDLASAAKFIHSCYDAKSGAFSDQPSGKPDVFSTAVGLMAVAEAGLPMKEYSPACLEYLAKNATEFEDIRIAAAGFETAKSQPAIGDRWRKDLLAKAHKDGTFGEGAAKPRATGGTAVTILRLGGELAHADRILETLNHGQNADGGWGKDDSGASDLETSYRVMRCYHMLKSKPKDVAKLRGFIASCRSDDGGYGVKPGQAANVGGVYFAGIILHWLGE